MPLPPSDALMNFPTANPTANPTAGAAATAGANAAANTARPPLPPLRVTQPRGASFDLGPGGLLRWQGWQLVVGFTARNSKYDRIAIVRRGVRPTAIVSVLMHPRLLPYVSQTATLFSSSCNLMYLQAATSFISRRARARCFML